MPDYTRDIKVEIATAFLVANDFMTIGTYVTVPVEEAERLRRGEREIQSMVMSIISTNLTNVTEPVWGVDMIGRNPMSI